MRLQLFSLLDPGQQTTIHEAPFKIGRRSDNNLVVGDTSVSRYHAVIRKEGRHLVIVDLDSTRGTYLNDKRVKSAPLKPGDIITFGKSKWRVERLAAEVMPSPSPEISEDMLDGVGQLFVSYSRDNKKIIDHLISKLTAVGYDLWIDTDSLVGGKHWRGDIVAAIRKCEVFLIALSPYSISSDNVLTELTLAQKHKKRIIPVVIQPIVDIPDSMEYQLSGLQRIDLTSNLDADYIKLYNALSGKHDSVSTPQPGLSQPNKSDLGVLIHPPDPPKSPTLAAVFSFLPGIGQIYLGQGTKGAVLLIISIIGLLPFGVVYGILVIICAIDSWVLGNKLKEGIAIREWEFFWNKN